MIIIIFFYNFSAKLKHFYLEIKNDFANDNKYLAVVTENGLWLKDEIDETILIVKAKFIEGEKSNFKITDRTDFENLKIFINEAS